MSRLDAVMETCQEGPVGEPKVGITLPPDHLISSSPGQVGQVVAARWPLDEQWYRTEVTAIIGPRSPLVTWSSSGH